MVNCCVPYCNSYRKPKKKQQEENDNDYISYHEFPCDLSLQHQWLKVIARKDFTVNDKSNSSLVCNKHFKEEDFIPNRKWRRLKKGAIPSIFPYFPAHMQNTSSSSTRKKIKKEPLVVEEELSHVTINPSIIQLSPMETCSSTLEKKLTPKEIMAVEEDLQVEEDVPMNSSTVEPSPIQTHSSILDKKVTQKEIIAVQRDLANIHAPINSPMFMNFSKLERKLKHKEKCLDDLTNEMKAKTLEVKRLKRQVYKMSKQLQRMSSKSVVMEKKLLNYSNNIHHQNLEKLLDLKEQGLTASNQDFLLTQLQYTFNKKFHWPEKTLRECILLYTVSPEGYRAIMERNLVTLPTKRTLSRYTGPIVNENDVPPLKIRIQEEVNSKPDEDLVP